MIAVTRIQKEFYSIQCNTDRNFKISTRDENDPYLWEATILGPENSLYEGGVFTININIP